MATKKTVKKAAKKNEDVIVGYKTVASNMASWHDSSYKYTVGKVHTVTVRETDRNNHSCGVGLHFAPTIKGAMSWADEDDYVLLEVQANKSDLLGKDEEKFRVAKLKVNKILKQVSMYGKKWEAALAEVNSLKGKEICAPSKKATPAAIKKAVADWGKAYGKSITAHIVDNIYEAAAAMDALDPSNTFYFSSGSDRTESEVQGVSIPYSDSISMLDKYQVAEIVDMICLSYVTATEEGDNENTNQAAAGKALLSLIKMGCLPIGEFSTTSSKKFVVFAPKVNPFTTPTLY